MLSCPVVAIGGADDPTTPEASLACWRETTAGETVVRILPGGHFFHLEHPAELGALICQHLDTHSYRHIRNR